MLKVAPSRIAAILDLKTKELEEVVYFVSHIVLETGTVKQLKIGEVLDLGSTNASRTKEKIAVIMKNILDQIENPESRDYKKTLRLLAELDNTAIPFSIDEATHLISKHTGAKFGIGAEAIEYLLKKVDIQASITRLKNELKDKRGSVEQTKIMRKLEVLDSLKKSGAKPE
jgi:DNA-directed RNA polymerase subunit beta'